MMQIVRDGGIAELLVQHPKPENPFSQEMTRQLTAACRELDEDDTVLGVLLWGGPERSFSVGGDFRDIRRLTTAQMFEDYIHEIIASYRAVLEIGKPVVVAIDRHAIGQGLQVALMADWIVGTDRSLYQMPELKNGVACPLGATILECLLGRAAMLRLVIGCAKLTADAAQDAMLINEVVPASRLREAALEQLGRLCSYPSMPYRMTKQIHNARLAQALGEIAEPAARAHGVCFTAGQADAHFENILNR